MIQDLLREIVGERWVERIDFDSVKVLLDANAYLALRRGNESLLRGRRRHTLP